MRARSATAISHDTPTVDYATSDPSNDADSIRATGAQEPGGVASVT
jgi:hypothetical protein